MNIENHSLNGETPDAERVLVEPDVIPRSILRISQHMMIALITGKMRITNIPEDANIIGTSYSLERYCWEMLIEHPSFNIPSPGECCNSFMAYYEVV